VPAGHFVIIGSFEDKAARSLTSLSENSTSRCDVGQVEFSLLDLSPVEHSDPSGHVPVAERFVLIPEPLCPQLTPDAR